MLGLALEALLERAARLEVGPDEHDVEPRHVRGGLHQLALALDVTEAADLASERGVLRHAELGADPVPSSRGRSSHVDSVPDCFDEPRGIALALERASRV